MAINFNTEYPINNVQKLKNNESTLTVCKLDFRIQQNTLMMTIPGTFPEYKSLKKGQNMYFIDNGASISFSTTKPENCVYYDRRIQWYGMKSYVYLRVPIPIQLRKKYQLDSKKVLQLISQGIEYECIFI